MQTQKILMIVGGLVAIAQMIASALTFTVMSRYSHFDTSDQCVLYSNPSEMASFYGSACTSVSNIFLTSLILAIITFIVSIALYYEASTRSHTIALGSCIIEFMMAFVAIVGAAMFTVGFSEAAKYRNLTAKSFMDYYSVHYASNDVGLVMNSMNAAWACVVFWIFMGAMDLLTFFYIRKNLSSTTDSSASIGSLSVNASKDSKSLNV